MNEFGMPQFNGGFGRYTPLPPPRRPQDSGSARPFLFLLLIISGLACGALLAWGLREHQERSRLTQRNAAVEQSYIVVLANRADLASFLTDDRTHLYHLAGRGDAAGRFATIAWQEETHSGILIADRMAPAADHDIYRLWHIPPSRKPTPCVNFQADPADTIQRFRCPEAGNSTSGFLISVESDQNTPRPGQIVYETR